MLASFLAPEYAPFAIALAVMIGIGLIEGIGLGLGHFDLETGIDGDAEGSSLLGWFGLSGELPILIWLTSLLGCFTLSGVAIQQGATSLLGEPLHWGLAVGGAVLIGAVLNGFAANGLARIMPGYESTVISSDDLLRQRGRILEGAARRGHPARAKIVDHHGQAHFVMVEPHDDGGMIRQGQTALLVRRKGGIFYALPDDDTVLQSI
ncbi:OB-fold-containig protein [Sphingomonas sp. 37zxx]|uniref:OB-fold-containig protein n=1 Tax=Sphingomonas sp. 37zxx TaxID=1550073 RepID=UPI00053BE6A7|nr:OB-fold-containig protein [Sphingomonas sp. 37zxx]